MILESWAASPLVFQEILQNFISLSLNFNLAFLLKTGPEVNLDIHYIGGPTKQSLCKEL